MLKVLICDDEVKVCKLIKNIIDWENLGLVLCGIAHTGQEALDMILAENPQIVITDIRMPDFDGLYLVKQAKSHNIDTHFIIISGYQYFEYAQTALRYGIVDYLLKPINGEELNNALEITRKRILSEEEDSSRHEELRNTLDQSLTHIEEYQVNAVFFQEPLLPLSVLRSENQKLYFSSDTFNACILKFDSPTFEHFVKPNVETAMAKTIHYIRRSTPKIFTDFLCAPYENSILGIMNYSDSQKEAVKTFLDQLLYESRKFAGVFDGISVTIGVGKAAFSYDGLKTSCQTAFDAAYSRIECGTNRIIYYSHFHIPDGCQVFLDSPSRRNLICDIDSCNQENFSQTLQYCMDNASSWSSLPYVHHRMAGEIFECFLRQIFQTGYVSMDFGQWRQEFKQHMEFAWNKRQLSQILMEFFDQYIQYVQEKSGSEVEYPIRQAMQYVEDHYAGDCSLTAVAEHVHLNATYFSSLFKQKTGSNFNSYVAKYRMDRAKLLLRDTNQTIQEISYQLTYTDNKHFRRLFKKYVGISPAQYRELYK